MTHRLLDCVQQFVTGTGIGGLTLGAATSTASRTMQAAGMVDGDTARVRIQDPINLEKWEIVKIEYNSGTIERIKDDYFISPTGDLTEFDAGDKIVSGVVTSQTIRDETTIKDVLVEELPDATLNSGRMFYVTDAATPMSIDVRIRGGGDVKVIVVSNGLEWRPINVPSSSTSLLRLYLGYMQVFDPDLGTDGEFLTYSQIGDFVGAYRSGEFINASGPNEKFPSPRLFSRKLEGPDYEGGAFGISTSGQSNDNGAGTGAGEESTGYQTRQPPMPDKMTMFNGGFNPHQKGLSVPARDVLLAPAQYATNVPLQGGINDGRDVPVFNEQPGMTTCLVVAMALPASASLHGHSWAVGSSGFAEVVGRNLSSISFSYTSGVGTAVYTGALNVFPGEYLQAKGYAPSGYNGAFEVLTRDYSGGYTTVTVAMANPGASNASTQGYASSPATAFKGALNAWGHWADNQVLAGKTPRLLAHQHLGHESSRSGDMVFAPSAYAYLRDRINELGARVNPLAPVPKIILPAITTPRSLHEDYATRSGHASETETLWREVKAREGSDPDFQTCSLFFVKVANDTFFPTPHSDAETQPMVGAKIGNLIIDLLKGEEIAPPTPNDDFEFITSNPTIIEGTLPYEFVVDTTEIVDPPFHGVQVFNAENLGAAGAYEPVALVSAEQVTGPKLQIQSAEPMDPRRLVVGVAYAVAQEGSKARNSALVSVSYSEPYVQVEFLEAHGQTVGGPSFAIVQAVVSGASINGFHPTAEVVNETTLKFEGADPGTWTPGTGRIAVNGEYGNGRAYGNRTPFRKAGDARHISPIDGSPRWDYMLPNRRYPTARAGVPGLYDQIVEIGSLFKAPDPTLAEIFTTVYDFADADCAPDDATTTIANLGSLGSSEDLTKTNMALVGTPDSKSRLTYLNSTGAGRLTPIGAATTWANAHKAGQGWWGLLQFRFKTHTENQYFGTTWGQEGSGIGPGVGARVASGNVFQLRSGAWALNGPTLVDGTLYTIAWGVQDGEIGWLNVNGTITTFNVAYSSPSSDPAQFAFRLGTSGSPQNRTLVSGLQLFLSCFGGGTVLPQSSDIQPLFNSVMRRMNQDVY